MYSRLFAHKKTILLVEDNFTDELMTVRAIEKMNASAEIVVARTGAEALDYLFGQGQYAGRNIENPPSFIFLDLKLPKLDGLSVLKKIRANENTKMVPVIILTSSGEDKDILESYRLGANSFVQKPVDSKLFFEMAQTLGLYWFNINALPNYNLRREMQL